MYARQLLMVSICFVWYLTEAGETQNLTFLRFPPQHDFETSQKLNKGSLFCFRELQFGNYNNKSAKKSKKVGRNTYSHPRRTSRSREPDQRKPGRYVANTLFPRVPPTSRRRRRRPRCTSEPRRSRAQPPLAVCVDLNIPSLYGETR